MKPLARSYLFVPGSRPERFVKALAAGADAVILDLEDAVAPADKDAARDAVQGFARAHQAGAGPAIWVRVNGSDTSWFQHDLATLAPLAGLAGIMLPKAERRAQVEAVLEAGAHGGLGVLPIVETAHGFDGLAELCAAPRVSRLVFGTLDFQIDLGIDGEADELDFFRSRIVLASRLAGLGAPVDGVATVLDDAALIEAQARRARRFGFGGKLCIHPRQVEPVHRAYAWSEAEQDGARRVLDAVEKSAGAAVAVDGKMVDMPVILRARRILGE